MANADRIALLDLARGAALIAMTIYHFSWDLAAFGLVRPQIMAEPAMIWFARLIASSFLFLVGFSLFLAHGRTIEWAKFARRLVVILAAAALITLATFFATPDAFIFFGILHIIAVGSVFGLAFLRLPWWMVALCGAFFLLGRDLLAGSFFNTPTLWWTGLSTQTLRSNDFVPIFPFFGVVLFGIAAAKLCSQRDWIAILQSVKAESLLGGAMRFIGRHSLVYYLLHQPVLIGFLAGFLWLSGYI